MASAGRAARRDRGAVHVHSAALLQQLLDAAQRLQEHLASAARDLPSHSAAASCVSIAQACAVPTATHGSTAAHPPEPKPASRQPSPDPASTPGGASALPGAAPGRPDGLDVAAAALPGGTAAPSEPLKAQLFTCEQELEPRLPEAAGPAGAQGEAFAEQAAAASCPSNAPGAGLAQMLASVATGLDPKTGVVAEVAAILAADAAARAGQGVPGPSPEAHRRSCAPRRPAASAHTGSGRMPRDQEQPPWGRSAEGVDRRRAGGARWRMRQGRGVRPDAGGAPVTEARARGGARSRAMLPATEWTRVEATPDGYHRTPRGDLQVPPQSPAAAAAARAHFALDGSVGAAPARGDERRHSASPHRSLLEVLQYAGAAVRSLGSAARPAACPDLEAARSDRWLRALWLEGAPPGGKALPPSNPSAEQGG